MADQTHLNSRGSQFLANVLSNDLGLFAVVTPRSLSVGFNPPQLTLSYGTATGIMYGVENSANGSNWQTVFTTSGDGAVFTTNIPLGGPIEMFRLRLQPQ